jgi:hypothetical protein
LDGVTVSDLAARYGTSKNCIAVCIDDFRKLAHLDSPEGDQGCFINDDQIAYELSESDTIRSISAYFAYKGSIASLKSHLCLMNEYGNV